MPDLEPTSFFPCVVLRILFYSLLLFSTFLWIVCMCF